MRGRRIVDFTIHLGFDIQAPMKLSVSLLALLLLVGCQRKIEHVDDASLASHGIELDAPTTEDGTTCTATAIGPHALLTAAHCIIGTNVVKVDGHETEIVQILYDEEDHAILLLSKTTFDKVATLEQRLPHPFEQVYFVGNPGKSRNIRRNGWFLRSQFADVLQYLVIFQLPAFPGDSGAGIIGDNGKVIAVVSIADKSAEVGAFPLSFTPEQLAQASK